MQGKIVKYQNKEIKWKMINNDVTGENAIAHNLSWLYIPHHPQRVLIIRGSGSGITKALPNLINHQPDIDKTYLYTKDWYKAKYQFLINKRENVGLKN